MAILDHTHQSTAVSTASASVAAMKAWPNLRRTAELLDVDVSSLSRTEIPTERRGREKCVPPGIVIELARYYKRRPLEAVAADLIQLAIAQKAMPAAIEQVELDVDAALDQQGSSGARGAHAWLDQARRDLPPELFAEVEAVVLGDKPMHPGLRGARPDGRG